MKACEKQLSEIIPHDWGMNDNPDKSTSLDYEDGFIIGFRKGWETALRYFITNKDAECDGTMIGENEWENCRMRETMEKELEEI